MHSKKRAELMYTMCHYNKVSDAGVLVLGGSSRNALRRPSHYSRVRAGGPAIAAGSAIGGCGASPLATHEYQVHLQMLTKLRRATKTIASMSTSQPRVTADIHPYHLID